METEARNLSNEVLEVRDYDFDNDLIETVRQTREPGLKVYQPAGTAVVLGRGSDPNKEINYDACLTEGVTVYQRPGGGCTVVLDTGNVIVSVVLPIEGFSNNRLYFNKLSQWLIDKLEQIGIPGVYQESVSDLVYNGKKFCGSCIQRNKDYLYYSTTLLVEPQVQIMERYLTYPPREPEYRNGRSHTEFVGSLPVKCGVELAQALRVKLNNKTAIAELKRLI
ncbi:MAG: hypothetical protein P9X24_11895 [Candidatus Hatepunaea meridiana]|nr:hypothetical protein [Candidatus Hatepunaea meridiana]